VNSPGPEDACGLASLGAGAEGLTAAGSVGELALNELNIWVKLPGEEAAPTPGPEGRGFAGFAVRAASPGAPAGITGS